MYCVEVLWWIYWYLVIHMTTLDPALDKLRNKELSFGCMMRKKDRLWYLIYVQSSYKSLILWWTYWIWNSTAQLNMVAEEYIIWHPLTWGRLCHLGYPKLLNNKVHSREDTRCEEMWKLLINIEDLLLDMQSFDQNELQRMQHEKRPKLRELLIKFAEYIYLYNW